MWLLLAVLVTISMGPTSAQLTYQKRLAEILPNETYVIPGDLMIGVLTSLRKPGMVDGEFVICGPIDKTAFESIYTLKYALGLLNNDSSILPGTSVGLYFLDDCRTQGVCAARTLQFLSDPVVGPMPGSMSLNLSHPPLSLVGPYPGMNLQHIGHLAKVYGVPIVSPSGGASALTNRYIYPSVFGVSPTITSYSQLLLDLVVYFKWQYITFLYSDKDYGLTAYKLFHQQTPAYNICIADSVMFYSGVDYTEAAYKVINANASVLVVFCDDRELTQLLDTMYDLEVNHTSSYILLMTQNADLEEFQHWRHRLDGSIQIEFQEMLNKDLLEYLFDIWPGEEQDNIWLQEYWADQGWDSSCSRDDANCMSLEMVLPISRIPLLNRALYALFAIVQSIQTDIERKCPHAFGSVDAIMECVDPSDLVDILYEIRVVAPTRTFHFNPQGDATVSYNIFQEQGIKHVLIGEHIADLGLVDINDSLLYWGENPWNMQDNGLYPKQICSEPCGPGEFRLQGELMCCWTCFPCRVNEIVSDDGTTCVPCPDLYWPLDENQLECIRIPNTYLTFGDVYGMSLSILAGIGLILGLVLTAVVIMKRELRVIKGSGWHMLLIILLGIYMAFGTVFLHIAQPTGLVCIAARCGFHMAFTLIFGPLFVKTNRIFQLFLAASKLSRNVRMGSELSQQILVTTIIIIQISLTVVSLIKWPADRSEWMPIFTERYVELYCDVPSISLIVCTSFNLLLVLGCSVLAFLARSLPDNFNESWYIFLCVSATLFVWIAFFTTYFSAYYVYYKAALLAAALILNALVVILALFGPKIYALIFVADDDIKISNFTGTASRGGTRKDTKDTALSNGSFVNDENSTSKSKL